MGRKSFGRVEPFLRLYSALPEGRVVSTAQDCVYYWENILNRWWSKVQMLNLVAKFLSKRCLSNEADWKKWVMNCLSTCEECSCEGPKFKEESLVWFLEMNEGGWEKFMEQTPIFQKFWLISNDLPGEVRKHNFFAKNFSLTPKKKNCQPWSNHS